MIKAALGKLSARLSFRTRYTRGLEEEIARLRAENRALINSILGVAGLPPVRAAAYAVAQRDGAVSGRAESGRTGPRLASHAANASRQSLQAGTGREPQPAATLRRRSWQQIGRALEVEDARAARRERESDTETFPTPRRVVGRLA